MIYTVGYARSEDRTYDNPSILPYQKTFIFPLVIKDADASQHSGG